MSDRCPTCHATGVDAMHPPRCAYEASLRADVIRRGAELGVREALAADLWSHLNDIYSDGRRAHRAALNVMDLGWRPVVGQDKEAAA